MSIDIACTGAERPFVIEQLESLFTVHDVSDADDLLAALAPIAERVRGIASHGMAGLPGPVIDALPNLEICSINGVGLETTDLAKARERGIVVTTAPVLYDDVADIALALALAASRHIVRGDRFVREGKWLEARMPLSRTFSRKRAGLLGLGNIGQAVAARLAGFDMSLSYYDPIRKTDTDIPYAADAVSLAAESDFLFVCAASPRSAPPLVTAEVIEALGPDGILVNVARGWLVDEPALVDALGAGRLGAAGLDVFVEEPIVPPALMALDNVVLMPHHASSTEECMRAMGDLVVNNLRAYFQDGKALTPVP